MVYLINFSDCCDCGLILFIDCVYVIWFCLLFCLCWCFCNRVVCGLFIGCVYLNWFRRLLVCLVMLGLLFVFRLFNCCLLFVVLVNFCALLIDLWVVCFACLDLLYCSVWVFVWCCISFISIYGGCVLMWWLVCGCCLFELLLLLLFA